MTGSEDFYSVTKYSKLFEKPQGFTSILGMENGAQPSNLLGKAPCIMPEELSVEGAVFDCLDFERFA